VVGFGFALNGLAHSLPAFFGCMAIFTLGEMLAMPVASAYVADLAPASLRGRYMGVYGLTWSLALIVGPGMGIALLASGPAALWLACGALGVIAAVLMLSVGRHQRVRGAPAGQV